MTTSSEKSNTEGDHQPDTGRGDEPVGVEGLLDLASKKDVNAEKSIIKGSYEEYFPNGKLKRRIDLRLMIPVIVILWILWYYS